MEVKKWQSVTLQIATVEKLEKLKHPGQSLDGVVQELIEKVGK